MVHAWVVHAYYGSLAAACSNVHKAYQETSIKFNSLRNIWLHIKYPKLNSGIRYKRASVIADSITYAPLYMQETMQYVFLQKELEIESAHLLR